MSKFLIKLIFFVFIFFSRLTSAQAVIQNWEPPEEYGEAESYDLKNFSEEKALGMGSQSEELSMKGIFGDEQVFPFPPGLGN